MTVYEQRRQQARERFAPSAVEYEDYTKLLDRKDIDAVVIVAPDHWPRLDDDAIDAGKDVTSRSR